MVRQGTRRLASGLCVTAMLLLGACATAPRGDECSASPSPCVAPGESFAVDTIGRRVTPGDLRITLGDVPEDSRCPTGVQCVWAGRARVLMRVDSANYQRSIQLRTDSATTSVFGHTLTLDSVLPRPRAGQQIARGQYRAWVHVTRP